MINVSAYWRLGRFDKPIGTWLLLWPTLAALVLAARGLPTLKLLIIFMVGTLCMRAAGCVANDMWDRDIDGRVQRTRKRPLATQELSPRQALPMLFVFLASALGLVLLTNQATVLLAVIAASLAMCYPLAKRCFAWPQFILGLSFAMSVLMAWTATQSQLPLTAWVFFFGVVAWVFSYDTLYAMADRADDLKIGIYSSAITFGQWDLLGIGVGYFIAWSLWLATGLRLGLNPLFFIGLALIAVHFVWQIRHAATRKAENCFKAFLSNHLLGGLLCLSTYLGCLHL